MKQTVGVVVGIGLLLLVACGSSKQAEQMHGLWRREAYGDYQFWRFEEDGTYSIALSIENLDNAPWVEGEYWFEKGNLYLKDTAASPTQWSTCLHRTTVYEIDWVSEGKRFNLVAVDDQCAGHRSFLTAKPFVRWFQ
jgi:hypothetical protein